MDKKEVSVSREIEFIINFVSSINVNITKYLTMHKSYINKVKDHEIAPIDFTLTGTDRYDKEMQVGGLKDIKEDYDDDFEDYYFPIINQIDNFREKIDKLRSNKSSSDFKDNIYLLIASDNSIAKAVYEMKDSIEYTYHEINFMMNDRDDILKKTAIQTFYNHEKAFFNKVYYIEKTIRSLFDDDKIPSNNKSIHKKLDNFKEKIK